MPPALADKLKLSSPLDPASQAFHALIGTEVSQPYNEAIIYPTVMTTIVEKGYKDACELAILPMMYIDGELIYSKTILKQSLIKCKEKRFQFAQFFLNDMSGTAMHANMLLIEKDTKNNVWRVERFDPHGNKQAFPEDVDPKVEAAFAELLAPERVQVIPPHILCPFSGPQYVQEQAKIRTGYCQTWVLYYLHLRVKHPEADGNFILMKLREKSPEELTRHLEQFVMLVRGMVQASTITSNDVYGDNLPAITKTIYLLHWLVIVFPDPESRTIIRRCIDIFKNAPNIEVLKQISKLCDEWTVNLKYWVNKRASNSEMLGELVTNLENAEHYSPVVGEPQMDTFRNVTFTNYYNSVVQSATLLSSVPNPLPPMFLGND